MTEDAQSAIEVTEENFGGLLIEALSEILATQRGEIAPTGRVQRLSDPVRVWSW